MYLGVGARSSTRARLYIIFISTVSIKLKKYVKTDWCKSIHEYLKLVCTYIAYNRYCCVCREFIKFPLSRLFIINIVPRI